MIENYSELYESIEQTNDEKTNGSNYSKFKILNSFPFPVRVSARMSPQNVCHTSPSVYSTVCFLLAYILFSISRRAMQGCPTVRFASMARHHLKL